MTLEIRRAATSDIPRLQEIFAIARKFMKKTGNPTQWGDDYPTLEMIGSDIACGDSYVCVKDGKTVGSFMLHVGDDPTYHIIEDGQWLNDGEYATIHRIASSGEVKGILHSAMQFALKTNSNIRIDTHRDNHVMQSAILKEGFRYCGVIHCWNGEERLAYQYAKELQAL